MTLDLDAIRARLAAEMGDCGYAVTSRDGEEEPCGKPAVGWRWYQDCEHEDILDAACFIHENEGGAIMAALAAEVERLRRTEAQIKAEALREASGKLAGTERISQRYADGFNHWLLTRADRIESEARP